MTRIHIPLNSEERRELLWVIIVVLLATVVICSVESAYAVDLPVTLRGFAARPIPDGYAYVVAIPPYLPQRCVFASNACTVHFDVTAEQASNGVVLVTSESDPNHGMRSTYWFPVYVVSDKQAALNRRRAVGRH